MRRVDYLSAVTIRIAKLDPDESQRAWQFLALELNELSEPFKPMPKYRDIVRAIRRATIRAAADRKIFEDL